MELLDHGSRNPISYGQHKIFDTEVGSLGVCVRSNRMIPMESTDIKDLKVETLAAMAVRDDAYMRIILVTRVSWRMCRKFLNNASSGQTGRS